MSVRMRVNFSHVGKSVRIINFTVDVAPPTSDQEEISTTSISNRALWVHTSRQAI